MAEGLQRHGLSREAAEDPDILLKRIERIAARVHRILQRPAEHPPVTFSKDESFGGVPDPETTEKEWDEMFKHNRRQQERLQRSLEERRSRGEDDDKAFENALDDLALEIPGEEPQSEQEPWREEEEQSFEVEDLPEEADAQIGAEEDAPFEADDERHPLLKRAMDLLHDLHTVFRDADARWEPSLRTLFQGAGDAMGGLALFIFL